MKLAITLLVSLFVFINALLYVNSARELTDANFKSVLSESGAKFVKVSLFVYLY